METRKWFGFEGLAGILCREFQKIAWERSICNSQNLKWPQGRQEVPSFLNACFSREVSRSGPFLSSEDPGRKAPHPQDAEVKQASVEQGSSRRRFGGNAHLLVEFN